MSINTNILIDWKRCRCCGGIFRLSKFCFDKKSFDGYSIYCFNCRREKSRNSKWRGMWIKAMKKYDFKCAYCGIDYNLEVHHKRPLTQGGRETLGNLIVYCQEHHLRIGHKGKWYI